jgi:hypothetical protein
VRLSLVIGTALLAVLATFTAASAHSGDVTAEQDCRSWSVHVYLNHNTTPDRTVEVVTTIAGTTGITDGHYDTDVGEIWSASGTGTALGTVTLDIYQGDSLEFTASATLSTGQSCEAARSREPRAWFKGPCGDPYYRAVFDNTRSGVPVLFRWHYRSYVMDTWVTRVRTVPAHALVKTSWRQVVGWSQMTIRAGGQLLAHKDAAAPGNYRACGR